MTAVSQSYPNYLGGLNEQPDELKKPGQLVEALNVIPDPTIGLTRRPGFKLIDWVNLDDNHPLVDKINPEGTWFEMEVANTINQDYIYFGCVNPEGTIAIFNQDGVEQNTLYASEALVPHKKYEYKSDTNEIISYDSNDELEDGSITPITPTEDQAPIEYFLNGKEYPLKYCVSKSNIVFSNPQVIPTISREGEYDQNTGLPVDANKYYSFLNLKQIDTENYTYQFRRYYADETFETYRKIKDLEITKIDWIYGDYKRDLTFPLETLGPFLVTIPPNEERPDEPTAREDAVIEVTFQGRVVQREKDDGTYENEARYTWSTKIINPGKGFRKSNAFSPEVKLNPPGADNPEMTLFIDITDTQLITGTEFDLITPDDISNNNTAEEILAELADKFKATGLDKVVVTGAGLYLENSEEFSISTSEIAVADVLNSQKFNEDNPGGDDPDPVPIVRVNDVTLLPVECYPGFIAQVSNSFNNENDYYLQYTAETDAEPGAVDNVESIRSDGYWKEIAKPYEATLPNIASLPHMITVMQDTSNTEFYFVASPIEWIKRTAGTAKDNPSMFPDRAPITEVNYYKNRLFMLTSVGTVLSTQAGDINNLFLNTAIDVSAIDPIDVIANTNQRVPLHGSAVVNNAMVIFGESEQYSLTTSNDILTTSTANVTKISNYTYDKKSRPIYLGTNLAFVSSGLTRFYEMTNIYDRGPIDINERSQQIQTQFGQGFNMPVSSREQSMALIYKNYSESNNSRSMYMYRFRQENSQESSQTSWVRWQVPHPIAYVSLPSDKLFVVVVKEGKCCLYYQDSGSVEGLPASGVSVVPKFTDGYTDTEDGEKFTTRITFPTIYPRSNDKSDVTSNLTIHRLKLSTAAIGTYNLNIQRKGYDDYDILVEQTPSDEYRSEFPTLYGEKVETVPVYTRSKNLTVTMSTDYDAPLTLQSMTWEGDWNPPYYKRV